MFGIVNLFILFVFIIGIILLQMKLVKSKSRWPGLMLPIISFIFTLTLVYSMALTLVLMQETILIQDIILLIINILLFNIPTMILLAIYFSARKKRNSVSEIEKMAIQDLD